MLWTTTQLTAKDGLGASKLLNFATDGTNFLPQNMLVDSAGNPIGSSNPMANNVSQIGGAALALGQAKKVNSLPIAQSGGILIAGQTLTRQANTTAYADGQHVSNASPAALTATVAPANGVPVSVVRCWLQSSRVSTLSGGIFKIFVFNQAPTSIAADGATFTCTGANCAGYFDVTLDQIFTDFSCGWGYPHIGAAININPASNSQNLYYLIAAHAAYTPISGETLQAFFEVL